MKPSDFENSPSGRLVATERAQRAFVPDPLPPGTLDMNAIAGPLAAASQALGELNGIGRTVEEPFLLIRPLQTREALTSSSMENTYTTANELLLLEAGSERASGTSDTREVANYRRALAEALDSIEQLPLSLRIMRNAHRTLLTGVRRHRGLHAQPGELKSHQNFIGGTRIEDARFIPPPPQETIDCIADLENFLNRKEPGLPGLIDSALIHYQFETIHPFADGNGRVGRILIILHLVQTGLVDRPILYLSPIFEHRKDAYIDRLYNVSRYGAWTEWVVFFLEVVTQASRAAISTADRLFALQKDYRSRLHRPGLSANAIALADHLFAVPVLTIPQAADLLHVTYPSALKNINRLVETGILIEIPGTSNPKYFAAPAILDLIEDT